MGLAVLRLLLVTLGGRPGPRLRVGRSCTLHYTSSSSSVCLSQSGQRHYLLWGPRTCSWPACAQGGASSGGSHGTDKSQASSFLRALVPAETSRDRTPVPRVGPAEPGGRGEARGPGDRLGTFGNKIFLSTHAIHFLCAGDG